MATIDKIERISGFLSGDNFEVSLSCGHKFTVERQPSIRTGDDFKCPLCGD